MSTWNWIWTSLLTAGAIVESVALAKRNPDMKAGTFSNYCRWLAGTNPPRWWRWPVGVLLAIAEVWWFGHVMFGWGP